MEISRSLYTDLIFHILAHMKIDNASDIYDADYIRQMENRMGRRTAIPEGMIKYYCTHFERLSFINFLHYDEADSLDAVIDMIRNHNTFTEEECDRFIHPFCRVIRDISADFTAYWEESCRMQADAFDETYQYFEQQHHMMQRFFTHLEREMKIRVKVLIAESMRCNGRGFMRGDMWTVILPFPGEQYSMQQLFMQLVHECTHVLTDPLLDSIRMDDGSHDFAEYQVILFDLWLFQRDSAELSQAYADWLSQDVLDQSERMLSNDQKLKLQNRFRTLK